MLKTVLSFLASISVCVAAFAADPPANGAIRLLVRGDDLGVAQAANEACVLSYRSGVVRSVEIIVPGAWFLDAVRCMREVPGLDVGVHLTLTSEWERCKWRPLTHAPSLVDSNGFFHPTTKLFLNGQPVLAEVEAELRAQIELARRHLPQISHLSSHMGTPTCTPELRAIAQKLAREYGLRLETEGVQSARGFRGGTPAEREASLVTLVENLKPGTWLLVEHPGLDTPEMRAFGHPGYENVAADRAGVTAAFTSAKVQQVIANRGIKLIGYKDLSLPR